MHKYEIIIFWSEEDQSFVADVPEWPGCMAHGVSPDEVLDITPRQPQLQCAERFS
jgi:predicted RNase H-like HicB family nuclease